MMSTRDDSCEQFLKDMLSIAEEGGNISLELIQDSAPSLKADNSVVTQADLQVSQLVHARLQKYLETGQHCLVDEEDPDKAAFFQQGRVSEMPYLWAVDPIDGTRCFSNRLPQYGLSIGLFKDFQPWMGVVYFPVLREMFVCDGTQAYFIEEAFGEEEKRTVMAPRSLEITQQTLFFINDMFFEDYKWDYHLCRVMMPCCAIGDICWPALGRGCGAIFQSYLWDFAGSWPIARAAGLDFRHLRTGRVLKGLQPELFHQEGPLTWKLKEPHILSSEANFPLIQKAITSVK